MYNNKQFDSAEQCKIYLKKKKNGKYLWHLRNVLKLCLCLCVFISDILWGAQKRCAKCHLHMSHNVEVDLSFSSSNVCSCAFFAFITCLFAVAWTNNSTQYIEYTYCVCVMTFENTDKSTSNLNSTFVIRWWKLRWQKYPSALFYIIHILFCVVYFLMEILCSSSQCDNSVCLLNRLLYRIKTGNRFKHNVTIDSLLNDMNLALKRLKKLKYFRRLA